MRERLMKVYYKSPSLVKRLIFNIEAIRRNHYRRSREYKLLSKELDFTSLINVEESEVISKLNVLLEHTNKNVEFYKGFYEGLKIKTYKDLNNLPVLNKEDVRKNRESLLCSDLKSKKAWSGSTSGSTGSPLNYYKDPKSVMLNQILYDKYYEYLGCDISKKRIRFSGIKTLPFEKSTPPFWVYIDIYKQLQCSVYHIGPSTYNYYIKKIKSMNANFGTGLPSAWTALSRFMNNDDVKIEGLKAIILDSEELTYSNRIEIEKAFCCPVYSTYGLGEVGMFAVECKEHHYHIIPYTHIAEVVDNNGHQLPDGNIGEIVVTDLYSMNAPFIRYKTGDLGVMSNEKCACGLNSCFFTKIVGRIEDYIITKDGRRFSRISLIVKRAKNIKESQIVQTSKEGIMIRVVPDKGFDPQCMKNVVDDAREFVGDMIIEWEAVQQLERMPSGKVKFLIRKEGADT